MEVEKRMNLSLDDIIKQRSKPSAQSNKQAGKGSSFSKKKLSGPKAKKGITTTKRQTAKPTIRLGTKKVLVPKVQGKPLRPRNGGVRKVIVQPKRSVNSTSRQQQRKPLGRGRPGVPRASVSKPQARNLTVTIRNDRALGQQQALPQTVFPSQVRQWSSPAQRSALGRPLPVQQAAYGYGPRNLLPRDEAAALAVSRLAPTLTRASAQGLGQGPRTRGRIAGVRVPLRGQDPFIDYDNSRTNMRMDGGR